VDSVVSVIFHSERVLRLKMLLDNGLLNVLMVYAPHSEKPEEETKPTVIITTTTTTTTTTVLESFYGSLDF